MSALDRPYITVLNVLSIDGRVIPSGPDEWLRQRSDLASFDAVAADGCDLGEVGPVLRVWLGPGSAAPENLALAAASPGPAVLFTPRVLDQTLPAHVRVARERSGLVRRLYRLRRDFQARRMLCPLGCSISPELIAQDLVDEIRLLLLPSIVGGRKAPTLSGPPGLELPRSSRWSLRQFAREKESCSLVYRRV